MSALRAVIFMALAGHALALASAGAPAGHDSAALKTAVVVRSVEPVNARQLRGVLDAERGKVLVVNFWGSWCAPCLKEIPDLLAVEREFAPRGLVLIGVAMDERAALDTLVRPFHAKYFPDFRSYARDEPDMDTLASVIDPRWNEMLPTTYLIDRQGKVLARIQGRKTRQQLRELVLPLL